jgi:hypothetical protein
MNRHYVKSRPISETLLAAGRYLMGGLSVIFLLLSLLLIASEVKGSGDISVFFLAVFVPPPLLLSFICFAAYRAARRGSFAFYWWVAGAVLIAVLAGAASIEFGRGFWP